MFNQAAEQLGVNQRMPMPQLPPVPSMVRPVPTYNDPMSRPRYWDPLYNG